LRGESTVETEKLKGTLSLPYIKPRNLCPYFIDGRTAQAVMAVLS
jgi:hypothetical protein